MGSDGQGGDLLSDDESSTGKGVKDLAHDDVTNVDVWLTELDHECDTEDGEWDTEVEGDWLVAAGVTDDETDDDGPEAGTDGVDVGDIAGWRQLQVVDNLKHGGEVGVPDVETDEDGSGQHAGTENGSIEKQVVWDVGDWCKEALPEGEEDDHDASNGDHGNDERLPPALSLVGVNAERQEKETKSKDDEEESYEIELDTPVVDGLAEGAAGLLTLDDETGLLGLSLVVEEEEEERCANGWSDDGECAEAPSPAWAVHEGLGQWAGDPDSSNVDAGGEAEHETSVPQLRGISDEDTENVDSSGVSVWKISWCLELIAGRCIETYPTQ